VGWQYEKDFDNAGRYRPEKDEASRAGCPENFEKKQDLSPKMPVGFCAADLP
jgi:hypothetical protein